MTLSEGFWIAERPCSVELWMLAMNVGPFHSNGERAIISARASWRDTQGYIARVNTLTSGGFALPTEAQWEYACRAGTSSATFAGPLELASDGTAPVLNEIAWYAGNRPRAGPYLGRRKPNPWGLFDMLGGTHEWCADGLRVYSHAPVTDPFGALDGSQRVVRGGSSGSPATRVRAASRRTFDGRVPMGLRLIRRGPKGEVSRWRELDGVRGA